MPFTYLMILYLSGKAFGLTVSEIEFLQASKCNEKPFIIFQISILGQAFESVKKEHQWNLFDESKVK